MCNVIWISVSSFFKFDTGLNPFYKDATNPYYIKNNPSELIMPVLKYIDQKQLVANFFLVVPFIAYFHEMFKNSKNEIKSGQKLVHFGMKSKLITGSSTFFKEADDTLQKSSGMNSFVTYTLKNIFVTRDHNSRPIDGSV